MEHDNRTPAERQTERRLSELDGLMGQSDEGRIATEGVRAGASLILSDMAGPWSEPIKRVVDVLRGRHEENAHRAVRVLIEALGSNYDNTVQRLQADPQFADFVTRVMVNAAAASHQEKLDYYANLLRGVDSADPPGEPERERLLDTINALGRRHLRLFHAIAGTEGVPLDVADKGSVWASIEHVSGIPEDEAEADTPEMIRLQLLSAGWESTTNLRLSLTDFGLRFERFVTGRDGRRRPRWEAQLVTAQSRLLEELASDFGGERDIRITRESEGFFLTSAGWESLEDVDDVRRESEEFVARILLARSLQTPQANRPLVSVDLIRNWDGDAATVFRPAPYLDLSDSPAPDEFPSALSVHTVELLMARDPKVEEAVRLAAVPEWARLVESMAIVEADLSYPVYDLPMVAKELVDRFNAEANARGFSRPDSPGPAQVSIDEAAGLVRQVLKAWIMVKAGRWSAQSREALVVPPARKQVGKDT